MTTTALKLSTTATTSSTTPRAAARRGLRRWTLGRRLEVAGVLSLLGSSAAYALFALCHLG